MNSDTELTFLLRLRRELHIISEKMGLEAEALFYKRSRYKRLTDEVSVAKLSIRPGDVGIINNRDAIEAMGIVNLNNREGTVVVKNPKNISAVLYDDGIEDDEGREVDITKSVVLINGQSLSLYKKTRKGARETVLWFDGIDDEFSEAPNPNDKAPVSV